MVEVAAVSFVLGAACALTIVLFLVRGNRGD